MEQAMTRETLKLNYILSKAAGEPLIKAVCEGADLFADNLRLQQENAELRQALASKPAGKDGKPVLAQVPPTPDEPEGAAQ